MENRRTNPRLLCAELVQLNYEDERGVERKRVANLEDISLCGVCLQVEGQLQKGTKVSIRYGDGELMGTVQYCVFRDYGYFLGIRFDEGCRWSSKHYRPEHLLDPRDLLDQTMLRYEQVWHRAGGAYLA